MLDKFTKKVASSEKAPPGNKFKPGEYIVGIYLKNIEVKAKFGPRQIIVVQDEVTGKEKKIYSCKVLANEFANQRIRPGERVGLKYLGKEEGYHNWVVFVDREEEEGGEEGAEEGSEGSPGGPDELFE